jgi:hypothetical protein
MWFAVKRRSVCSMLEPPRLSAAREKRKAAAAGSGQRQQARLERSHRPPRPFLSLPPPPARKTQSALPQQSMLAAKLPDLLCRSRG